MKYRNCEHFGGNLQFSGSSTKGEKKVCVEREKSTRFKTYSLDGYYEDPDGSKVAIEFYGCLHHGCLQCYAPDLISPFKNKTMAQLNKKTTDREADLLSLGMEVDSIWECQWKKYIACRDDVQAGLDRHGLRRNDIFFLSSLNPRDTLRGGHCGNTKLLHECQEGEEIKYVDFTSLYPAMIRSKFYPMGHPIIITSDFSYEKDAYFGAAKCRVLPPKDLLHPVLPLKVQDENGGEKLIFTLSKVRRKK